MNTYVSGNLVRVAGTFTGNTGAVLDPTSVKVAVLEPGAALPTIKTYGTDVEVVKDGTGQYHLDIDADKSGIRRYRWQSTGNGQAANEGAFEVAGSPF